MDKPVQRKKVTLHVTEKPAPEMSPPKARRKSVTATASLNDFPSVGCFSLQYLFEFHYSLEQPNLKLSKKAPNKPKPTGTIAAVATATS